MVATLGVAAGYGLVISVFLLFMVERLFGARGTTARLVILGMTVGAIVVVTAGAGVLRARRR